MTTGLLRSVLVGSWEWEGAACARVAQNPSCVLVTVPEPIACVTDAHRRKAPVVIDVTSYHQALLKEVITTESRQQAVAISPPVGSQNRKFFRDRRSPVSGCQRW